VLALDAKDAEDAAPYLERHVKLRASVHAGALHEVRVGGDVVGELGQASRHGPAAHPDADVLALAVRDVCGTVVASRHHQPLIVIAVPEHDPDAPVAEPAGEQLGRLGEQLLEVQNRGDLAGDLGDGCQAAAAAALGVQQCGVLDDDG
jgi:hypothetical protein